MAINRPPPPPAPATPPARTLSTPIRAAAPAPPPAVRTPTRPPAAPAPPAKAPLLPYNLEGGFGGVDMTFPIYSRRGIRTGLFDLEGARMKKVRARWGESAAQRATFDIPDWLELVWETDDQSSTVAGETKASFQHNLTREVTAGFSFAGFGAEFSETFSESSFEETYHKYAAHYERVQVYQVRLIDEENPEDYLSARARADLASLAPNRLVAKYGTHFMTSAMFGGLQVYSSKLDVRDTIESEKLERAMKLSVEKKTQSGETAKGSLGAGYSDETVRKLHEMMSVEKGRTLGGVPGRARPQWIESLYVNPAVIGYDLRPLDELAPNAARRRAIRAAIEERLRDRQVTSSATLLAMMVDVVPYATDAGSGADRDLSVGRAAQPAQAGGWFYIGQWAVPAGGGFPGGYRTLIFRNVPGSDETAIVPALGFDRRWGKSSSWGLWTARVPAGYVSIGDNYEGTDSESYIGYVYYYGCVRADLVEDTHWTGQIWTDGGSGANDDGSIFGFENEDKTILESAGGPHQPRMFRALSHYGDPGFTPKKLKLDRIQILTDNWL